MQLQVFPLDILHDLLEGIIPLELALFIKKMIRLKYFGLEYLKQDCIILISAH